MMRSSTHHIMIMLIMLLCCLRESWGSNSGVGESKVMCKETERRALLDFKAGLDVYDDVLSSWGDEEVKRDCCKWIEIRCNNNSGRVVSLDLSHSTFNFSDQWSSSLLANKISSSLVHLEYLNYLNLSGIYFNPISIPSFIGNLSKLRYLDLSYTGLAGQIPPQLGNLSKLEFLSLSNDHDSGFRMNNLEWASRLSWLRVLDLSGINMSTAYDWAQVVTNLPHLTKLVLTGCSLPNVPLSLLNSSKALTYLDLSGNSFSGSISKWLFSYSLEYLSLASNLFEGSIPESLGNITTLRSLDFKYNELGGSIPNSLGNITTLRSLDLSINKLEGSIPGSLGNMTNLEYLNLASNLFEGEIPKSIWEICTLLRFYVSRNNLNGKINLPQSSSRCAHSSLKYLDLSENQITGSLPNFTFYPSLIELSLYSNRFNRIVSESISQLSKLEVLDIYGNLVDGVMSEAHFSKLFSLKRLDLSNNPSLAFNISTHWIPPFQLQYIYLGSCHLGPHFPNWLQTQKHLFWLDISNSQIAESVPNYFWNASPDLGYMNLSYNQISGSIPDILGLTPGWNKLIIDLTSNLFQGPIPPLLFQAEESYLSENNFSTFSSLCHAKGTNLSLLDISFNKLEGDLPNCWSHVPKLKILVLSNNKLSGIIPDSIGSLREVRVLDLGNNKFTGKLPMSLKECNKLKVLDLGENRLMGPVPIWIGDYEDLVILNLRFNQFNGSIPSSVCRLSNIQVLDLSINHFFGRIPTCVGNLTAMTKYGNTEKSWLASSFGLNIMVGYKGTFGAFLNYPAQVSILWKGKLVRYRNTLGLIKSIDLSNNNLVGNIPREIYNLDGLVALNFSRNRLTGQIPAEIGHLNSLEVLDLSRNQLSGSIPSSLSGMSFMNTLDVSDNDLSGKIPTSTQLQSFDASKYMGNPELCGDPLPNKCPGEEKTTSKEDGEDQESFITGGFYVALGLGFVVGFWGICGSLLFIKSWRYVYFMYLSGDGDWIYATAAMHKAKLMKIIIN